MTDSNPAPSQQNGQASRRRRTILALVVTDNSQAVSQKIIQEVKRNGSLLCGQGIYARTDRDVLLVALTA